MISINDVKDGELFNTESNQWIKVKEIKEKWNSMSFHDRKFYEVPNVRKPALYADEMIELIYDYIEEETDLDIPENIWEEIDKDFIARFQNLLNEIAEILTIDESGSGEAIDPTIDLKEWEQWLNKHWKN